MSNKIITKKEVVFYKDSYVELKVAEYNTISGHEGKWAYIERRKKQKAAVVLPLFDDSILLIKQYRIPVNSFVIEFPAGLIEEGEDIKNAALRELEEETGYTGEVVGISPALPTSPGLSSEEIYFVKVKITGRGSLNLEEVEDIENIIVPIKEINLYLKSFSEKGYKIDSKVWAFSLGLFL